MNNGDTFDHSIDGNETAMKFVKEVTFPGILKPNEITSSMSFLMVTESPRHLISCVHNLFPFHNKTMPHRHINKTLKVMCITQGKPEIPNWFMQVSS